MRTTLLTLFGLMSLTLLQATGDAQDSQRAKSVAAANLAAAKELSNASGRPIFAIAGRST